jgi:hypothetical protein
MRTNQILDSLSGKDADLLEPDLERVDLPIRLDLDGVDVASNSSISWTQSSLPKPGAGCRQIPNCAKACPEGLTCEVNCGARLLQLGRSR